MRNQRQKPYQTSRNVRAITETVSKEISESKMLKGFTDISGNWFEFLGDES